MPARRHPPVGLPPPVAGTAAFSKFMHVLQLAADATGPVLVPEVLLVPCLGYTREGFRLGYGGGYFDRWLEAHPGVTTIGLAWSCCEGSFEVQPHDQAMTVVVTEREVLAP